MNYLVAKLSDSLAGQLHGLSTAEAWTWLCSRFELSGRESIQSILAALRSLKAKNLDAMGKFLDEHEEVLSRAREVDFALVHDAAAGATPAQTKEALNLHYVYSDFILEGLPPTADWKAWAVVYRTSDLSTFAPREVLDKVRAEYNRLRANATANSGGLILANGNNADSTATAAVVRTSGKNSGNSNQQSNQRKKCKHCKKESPDHAPEKCWQNPRNPDNRLDKSNSNSGTSNKSSSSLNDKNDKDKKGSSKLVSLAAVTIAASIEEIPPD